MFSVRNANVSDDRQGQYISVCPWNTDYGTDVCFVINPFVTWFYGMEKRLPVARADQS